MWQYQRITNLTATVVSRVALVILQHMLHAWAVCVLALFVYQVFSPGQCLGHSSCDMASNQHNATCKCLLKRCGKPQQQYGLAEPPSHAWADQAEICG
jgi:hypothetical protein